jgi:UDPglucose 6-dehydrogenase
MDKDDHTSNNPDRFSNMVDDKKVGVIGIWHLGAVYSACMAELGYQVIGIDDDIDRVNNLNLGIPPVFEPGLKELITSNIERRRLTYTTDLKTIENCSYVMITFDTPVNENDDVDLSSIIDSCRKMSTNLKNGTMIIISSQVPVGTCDYIKSIIKQVNPAIEFDIAYCPENLRLGKAIDYFMKPDRIVIGADNIASLDRVEEFLSVITAPKLRMDLRSAEMTKHALNAFLATSISFANEIANLCDEVGADAVSVSNALKSDSRIGPGVPLHPGLAFSGGTLARDLKILAKLGKDNNYDTSLINGILEVNRRQNSLVIKKLRKIFGKLSGLTVGILGLTYKAGTSTLRRSASLEIIEELTANQITVKAYDPKANPEEVRLHKNFEFLPDPYTVAKGSDALVILTDWTEFVNLDFDLIKAIMKKPVIIDGKNLLNSQMLIQKGFIYSGVGRGKTS